MGGLKLNPIGEAIVRRGGADGIDNDGMLIHELIARAPGLSADEYQIMFVAIMEQYGEDALYAIRHGYVQFEEVRAGTRPETKEGNDD